MADNENQGSTGSFRQNPGNKRRREPAIIDAKATDVSRKQSAPPDEPAAQATPFTGPEIAPAPVEPTASATEEPVLFGQVLRGTHTPSASSDTPLTAPVETAPETAQSEDSVAVNAAEPTAPPEGTTTEQAAAAGEHTLSSSSGDEPSASGDEPSAAAFDTNPFGGTSSPAASDPMPAFAPPTPPRSSMPMILGGAVVVLLLVIAALLVTGSQRGVPDEVKTALDAMNTRLTALEARPDTTPLATQIDQQSKAFETQIAAVKASVEDLGKRVDDVAAQAKANAAAAPAAPTASAADMTALSGRVDDLSHKLDAMPPAASATAAEPVDLGPVQAKIADLGQRIDAVQSSVDSLPKVDLGPIETQMTETAHRVEGDEHGVTALAATVAALPKVDLEPLKAGIAANAERIAPLEAALSAPKSGDRVTEARAIGNADASRAAPLAVVAQAAAKRIDDGLPMVAEVDALRSLGVGDAALAPLSAVAEKGAPSAAALKAEWADVEPEVAATTRPKVGGGLLDKFAAGAFQIVTVRRVGAPVGEDPASVIARVGAALDDGNVAAALTEWSKLPDAARDASKGWADAARSRLDAETAAQALASQAIETLAKAKG